MAVLKHAWKPRFSLVCRSYLNNGTRKYQAGYIITDLNSPLEYDPFPEAKFAQITKLLLIPISFLAK